MIWLSIDSGIRHGGILCTVMWRDAELLVGCKILWTAIVKKAIQEYSDLVYSLLTVHTAYM